MVRDGDLPTIFHPKRVRTPSVVVTSEDIPDRLNGPSQPHTPLTPQPPLTTAPQPESVCSPEDPVLSSSGRRCPRSCCSELARKIYFGVCVTVLVTASWVVATHSIKYLYVKRNIIGGFSGLPQNGQGIHRNSTISAKHYRYYSYNAPFFTTWFCTNWTILFYPAYLAGRMISVKCQSPSDVISDCIANIREKGFTAARFLTRCGLFCLLWVATTYMYVHALRILLATDAMALFATNVSCVYLLSWVILHEQFVGVRIVAVILCDTGIALLAYMDGITSSPTLGGVVLAASAAAGFAVYKVLLQRVMGTCGAGDHGSSGATALFWSTVGILNATLLWPAAAALYLAGAETIAWRAMPWPTLLCASTSMLVFNLLTQFGRSVTYEMFVTLGLITSVPVSAALDVVLYGANFAGMKLAGMILIAVGFFLVMFPDNWPDYIMRLLRWSRRRGRGRGGIGGSSGRAAVDYRTGYIRSHLRSPSGRVR